jgi:tryptophan-rich sensory protein
MSTLAMFAFPATVLTLGMLGGLISAKSIPGWYSKLIKPSFNPPNWVFGPAWTTLYIMIGVSGYLIWKEDASFTNKNSLAWIVYFTQLGLNYLWTPLLFGFKRLFLALVEIVLLLISIWVNIFVFYPINPTASYLLIPYLMWVSFATLINYKIWQLNKDQTHEKKNLVS